MPPAVEAVVEASWLVETEHPTLATVEARALLRLETLWSMGWTVVPIRQIWASRLALVLTIALGGFAMGHLLDDSLQHTAVMGAALYGAGMAAGAMLLSWLNPSCRKAKWRRAVALELTTRRHEADTNEG